MAVNVHSLQGKSREVITLGPDTKVIYVVRDYVEYYVDTTGTKDPSEVLAINRYERLDRNVEDLTNTIPAYTYWIKFSIVNLDQSKIYHLEMFDYDIDEVSLYSFSKTGTDTAHSGYARQFYDRDLYHKNIGFMLSLPENDTVTCLMRFRSHKLNVLEPVIRSISTFYEYSVIEYLLLGIFYGFTCIIILYNLIYFVILKKIKYLYYLIYMSGITVYLMCRNGTGFQFLWPDNPTVNYWLGTVSGGVGISALLLFTNAYLDLRNKAKRWHKILIALAMLNCLAIPFQLMHDSDFIHQLIIILLLHVAFCVSIPTCRSGPADKWFLIGFIVLDVGFVTMWLEHMLVFPSTVFTVYILYFCINLQFIAISISLVQNIRQLANEKNKALVAMLKTADKNETMRILALKKQMSPHFIFNALNSILQRILSGNKEEASEHLVRFSKLIRKTMEQSDLLFSKLTEEVELLKLYLSMEAIRLGQTFTYSIEVSPEVKADQEEIPSFILQPFAENSIWHGLMPKPGIKNLWVRIYKEGEILKISIEDNGIGREKAAQNKKIHGSQSQGIGLIMERIHLLNNKYNLKTKIEIVDLHNSDHSPKGTRVLISTGYIHEPIFEDHYH